MFNKFKDTIESGDTVILYLSPFQIFALEIKDTIKNKHGQIIENIFQTSFGSLKIKELIGVKYGNKVKLSKGWGYILFPTPELWTQTLPHRTQIIYTPDISIILMQLDIKPGDNVIESGTGSGSLSHSLTRAIQSTGHLYTFDFHEERVKLANEDFKLHGLNNVTCKHRDVVQNGFSEDLHGKINSIFLDLPHPWLVIESCILCFNSNINCRFVSFSPCIEQVQRTCENLRKYNFIDINTYECIQKDYNIGYRNLSKSEFYNGESEINTKFVSVTPTNQQTQGHTGYITCATYPPHFARGN